MVEVNEYRVTFGQRYRTERHQMFPPAHPDGWFSIEVAHWMDAKKIADQLFGEGYSFVYDKERVSKEWYPLGELGRWTYDD